VRTTTLGKDSPHFKTLDVGVSDGVCTVTMNRPAKYNAMNVEMRTEFATCFDAIGSDRSIRVVVLTGAGRAFSGGGDINDFTSSPQEVHALMGRVSHRWFRSFWALPQPVIAAVNGAAAGGGCDLALGCDLVYASENAYFAQTFIEIGLVPDLGGAFTLPRLIGPARAKEMAFFGDRVGAARALALGLVNDVFPAERLLAEVQERARRLAGKSAPAIALTKRIINRAFESSMEAILDDELATQSFLFSTTESQEGVRRFLDQRGPSMPAAGEPDRAKGD
jgi:enoyl-CoA hydratase/carnithine racemase